MEHENLPSLKRLLAHMQTRTLRNYQTDRKKKRAHNIQAASSALFQETIKTPDVLMRKMTGGLMQCYAHAAHPFVLCACMLTRRDAVYMTGRGNRSLLNINIGIPKGSGGTLLQGG